MGMQPAKMSGVEKSAILLLCLGEEAAAKIFESLADHEVRLISRAMISIDHVPANVAREVLDDFQSAQKEFGGLFVEGNAFVKKALSAGGDPKRAELLMEQVTSPVESRTLETIAMMQPRMVAGLLESEHPQTVALILSTQRPEHTAKILGCLSEENRGEVMYRIARIDKVSPEVISNIEEALQREIGVAVGREQRQVGGIDKVLEIMGRMENGTDRLVLSSIEAANPEMAEAIRRKMFTFEDFVVLDGRSLQGILREVNNDQLTLALKTASEALRETIFSNISIRAADMIKEDLEAMGPVKLSEVELMQQTIVKIALKLEEEGMITIPGRGGDDVLV